MSLDITVYTKQLSDDLIPKIVKRLNDFDMVCEVHPKFSFSNRDGFLPFKFQLTNPPFEILKNKVLMSGFELYIDDFDFEREKKNVQPKPGLMDRLTGKKHPERPLASDEVDKRLKEKTKIVTFVWQAGDTFALRFASLTSAILTELADGVSCYPADNIWYENQGLVENAWKEVREYENALKESELAYQEFENWD